MRDDIIEAGFAGLRALSDAGDRQRVSTGACGASQRAGAATDGVEIALTRYGGPEVLVPRRARSATPGAGEARIRQTAVGVNFIDVYCRRGSFDLVPPGGVLGMEAAGVVESVGPNVANVRAGRSRRLRLCAARRLCVDARRCAPIFSSACPRP